MLPAELTKNSNNPGFKKLDLERRVAAALGTDSGQVNIEECQPDLSGHVLCCRATSKGRKLFAKTYRVDPYPVLARAPRFVLPWDELQMFQQADPPIGDQIRREWQMSCKFRALLGGSNLPSVEGSSIENRTIAFEEVGGIRMDRFVTWSKHPTARAESTRAALFKAGSWLRKAHDSSFQGFQTVDPRRIAACVQSLLERQNIAGSRYARLALEAAQGISMSLENCPALEIPVSLLHGDFSLANLIWNRETEQLWIIDFEHAERGAILRDLGSMVFNLRARLLYPPTSPAAVQALEAAFWSGYGAISRELREVVEATATSRIFHFLLPRLLTRRDRHGWLGAAVARAYIHLFEPFAIRRVLQSSAAAQSPPGRESLSAAPKLAVKNAPAPHGL